MEIKEEDETEITLAMIYSMKKKYKSFIGFFITFFIFFFSKVQ